MTGEPKASAVSRKTSILCVDDNADMTLLIALLIDAEPTMRSVGSLISADDLLGRVANPADRPHIVLLDGRMPGTDPMLVMKAMAAEHPDIRTIVVSGHDNQHFIIRAINHGAWGFVSKRHDPEEILKAIRLVAAGSTCFPDLDQ